MQSDLNNFIGYFNYRRMHQRYKLEQNGLRKSAEAHSSRTLTLNKKSANVKNSESIRNEKEVQKHSPFAYDSVETENKKKEVLECQLVTKS